MISPELLYFFFAIEGLRVGCSEALLAYMKVYRIEKKTTRIEVRKVWATDGEAARLMVEATEAGWLLEFKQTVEVSETPDPVDEVVDGVELLVEVADLD